MRRVAAVVLSVLATALGGTEGANAAVLRVAASGVGASVQIKPTGDLRFCNFTY